MKKIDISTKKFPNTFAMVDDDMFDELNQYKWHAVKSCRTMYTYRRKSGTKKPNGFLLSMHRSILNPPKGFLPDHKDSNGLNNQRSNLRKCTQPENAQNSSMRIGNKSGFKGVDWWKSRSLFRARIAVNKKRIGLGQFICPLKAARVYDIACVKHHGDFAKPNGVKCICLK